MLWSDRKRHFGLPLSFTRYRLTEDLFTCESGLLNLREEDIQLYRIRDLELRLPLSQRVFGTGTIVVHSSDTTSPTFEIKSVKDPRKVKDTIYAAVEKAKEARRMRTTEILDDSVEIDPDEA